MVKKCRNFKSTGEVLTVSQSTIDIFLEVIAEPEWIEWKKARGEIIIKPPETTKDLPLHITWETILYLSEYFPADHIIDCIKERVFIVDPPY